MLYVARYAAALAAVLRSAARAAVAVEAGRKPRAADLRTLGIDPAAFSRVAQA